MIEYLGIFYGVAKDIKDYLIWKEEEKIVDSEWLEKSGLKNQLEKSNCSLMWSAPDKVESRLLDGYEKVFEIDKIKRIKKSIKRKDGSILLSKSK